jgi:hypothetical protein
VFPDHNRISTVSDMKIVHVPEINIFEVNMHIHHFNINCIFSHSPTPGGDDAFTA